MFSTGAIETPHEVDRKLVVAINHVLLGVAILACSLYQLSPLAKASTAALAVLFAFYGMLLFPRIRDIPLITTYGILVSAWAGLSVMGVMEDSWTTIRDPSLAIRQAAPHLLFPFTAYGFAVIFAALNSSLRLLAYLYIALITIISLFVYGITNQAAMTDQIFIVNNLYSFEVFRIFFVAVIALSIRSNILFLGILLCMLLLSFSIQAQLCMIALAAVRYIPIRSWMIVFVLFLLVIGSLISTLYWSELLLIENNIGVRALFWHNSLIALKDSFGLGLGYGTESIVPYYPYDGQVRYFGPAIPAEYSRIGVHNSFFQLIFNVGLPGAGLMLVYIGRIFLRLKGTDNCVAPLDAFAAAMLLISIFVNMAFDSFNFLLGSAFLIGWMIYRADCLDKMPAGGRNSG